MDAEDPADRAADLREAATRYAHATAGSADPELFEPLTFLLTQVRHALGMDVVFVSRFANKQRVFEVVSADTDDSHDIAPGKSDPLLDTYCQRIVDGRLPRVIPDTKASPEAASLAITKAMRIGAYLSAPVVLPNGRVFGTVCCISHHARADLVDSDAKALRAVAEAIAASIDRKAVVRFASWTGSGR